MLYNFIVLMLQLNSKATILHERQNISGNIMQDIEKSLIKKDAKVYYGIDDFQKIFEKKRLIIDTIDEYKNKNKESKHNILRAQQRLYQIEQLAEKAQKQSLLLKNQIQKINDAHMMTKILTVEKMIKIKIDHEDLQKKKNVVFRIRDEKNRISMLNRSRNQYNSEKMRQMSLLQSKIMREYMDQTKFETIEVKRSLADKIKDDKRRLKDRVKRYEQFKIQQGRKNYQNKMLTLKETLDQRQKKLDFLYRQEIKEQKNYETTEQVTKQYLGSLFATQTI